MRKSKKNAIPRMKKVWNVYPDLLALVMATHDEYQKHFKCLSFICHDKHHVIQVANFAQKIAPNYKIGLLAAVAALCHNADRLLQKADGSGRNGNIIESRIIDMVSDWLDAESFGTFSDNDRNLIIDAVLHHSEPNGKDDSLVKQVLMDADRLANLGLDCIPRTGQFIGDDLPVLDPVHFWEDPEASFKNLKSIARAYYECKDWMVKGGFVGFRSPKAWKYARPRFAEYMRYLRTIKKQQREAGLVPYPKELRKVCEIRKNW